LQAKQEIINEIGRDRYNELVKLRNKSMTNHWYDPIYNYLYDIRNLDCYRRGRASAGQIFFNIKLFNLDRGALSPR
jgi:hypothetical protein